MANVFVEPVSDGSFIIEFADGTRHSKHFQRQREAIDQAKSTGHHTLVARVRHLNDKKIPDHWRSAD